MSYGEFMRDAALAGLWTKIVAPKYGIPPGLNWLQDTLPEIDLYAIGFAVAPTIYFDPSASSATSKGLGTLNNPYYTQAQVELRCKGDMSGQVLGIKRGTTLRVTGSNGFTLAVNGTSGKPFQVVPYGVGDLPIITAGVLRADWVLHSGSIYKITGVTQDTDVFQADVRVAKKSALAGVTAEGQSFYDTGTSTLYLWAFGSVNPNSVVTEILGSQYALNVTYSDIAATGYVNVVGMDVRKGRNISLRVASITGASNMTSCAGLQIIGCRGGQAGYDAASLTSASDGILLYGPSNTVRATGCMIIGCEAYDSLNNAYEIANTDGLIQDNCYGHDCGGNVIMELWSSNSNARIRNNTGLRAATTGRLFTGYHTGGIWLAIYNNIAGSSKSHTDNTGNWFDFNVIADTQTQGIELAGGTGTKIRHNTLYMAAATPTNRVLNLFANCAQAGSCDAEVSNNVLVCGNTSSRKILDAVCGTVAATDAGAVALTATLTGDNNIYLSHVTPTPATRLRTAAGLIDVGTSSIATYKAALVTAGSTFDSNSTAPIATTNPASNYVTSDYRPLATLQGIGKTGLPLSKYKDGTPYNGLNATLGANGT